MRLRLRLLLLDPVNPKYYHRLSDKTLRIPKYRADGPAQAHLALI
jgi:hypothetical protein